MSATDDRVRLSQEQAFLKGEADAFARRNRDLAVAAPSDDPVLEALQTAGIPREGTLLDVGGAAGRIAAGFQRDHPDWRVRVIEPSSVAIELGRTAFPDIEFVQGSITQPLSTEGEPAFDVVVVSGVLCWVERSLLSSAIGALDQALSDGGLMVISDFDVPGQRANAYAHLDGLFTFKQDYSKIFLALGTYHMSYRRSYVDDGDRTYDLPYDRHWSTTVLQKDLHGRYSGGSAA